MSDHKIDMQQFKNTAYIAYVKTTDSDFSVKTYDLDGLKQILTNFSFHSDKHVGTKIYDDLGQLIGHVREGKYFESKV